MTPQQDADLLAVLSRIGEKPAGLSHGDCVGADARAHAIAVELNSFIITIHPPSNPKLRAFCKPQPTTIIMPEKPYLIRNRNIVQETDVLIACPDSEEDRAGSGTWYTINYARKLRHGVLLLKPSGHTVWESGIREFAFP